MQNLKIRIIGESALLMHSARFADPLLDETKKHAALVKRWKKEKTDELCMQVAESEWRGSIYFDANIGPYIPGQNIKSAIVGGAKLSRKGANVKRGVHILEDKIKLEYKGPRTLDELFTKRFIDCRSVVVSGSRVMRYRPTFDEWSLAPVQIFFNPELIDKESIISYASIAGQLIGLGDYRPDCGGPFGRFTVELA